MNQTILDEAKKFYVPIRKEITEEITGLNYDILVKIIEEFKQKHNISVCDINIDDIEENINGINFSFSRDKTEDELIEDIEKHKIHHAKLEEVRKSVATLEH